MPRNFKSTAILQKPDPKFGSMLATKIINKLMQGGKKTTAQKIFYSALDLAEGKVEDLEGETQLERQEALFVQAIDNIRPSVEVRSKRVGGANYQVPMQLNRRRQQSLTFRWIITAVREEKGKPVHLRLAKELWEAARNEGKAVTTRENTHRMAEANRAFAHFGR